MADYQPVQESDLETGPTPSGGVVGDGSGALGGYHPVDESDLDAGGPAGPTGEFAYKGIPAAAAKRFSQSNPLANILGAAASRYTSNFVSTFNDLNEADGKILLENGYGNYNGPGALLQHAADAFNSGATLLKNGIMAGISAIPAAAGGVEGQIARETGAPEDVALSAEREGGFIGMAALSDVGAQHGMAMEGAAKAAGPEAAAAAAAKAAADEARQVADAQAQAAAPGIWGHAYRVDGTPDGSLVQTPLGRLPDETEATSQAKTVATALHLPPETADVIHKTYVQTGRPPAEVLMDAQTNHGGVLDDLVAGKVPTAYTTAYHGSPHEFSEFDASKIGTGEGSQAFGHGLYFAENPEVAETYTAAGQPSYLGADRISAARDLLKQAGGDRTAAIQMADQRMRSTTKYGEGKLWQDVVNNFDDLVGKGTGHLYKVAVEGHPDNFLDWDNPLSEQSPAVQSALSDLNIKPNQSGAQIYESKKLVPGEFTDKVAASAELQKRGIKGIRFLDKKSRDAGEGTRNMVVFDPKDVTITHRNGEPVTKAQSEEIKADQMRSGSPEQGVSKIGQSIEAKAVEAKLTNGFAGTAGYDKITIADQAEKATNLVNGDIDAARAVIRGDKPLPDGLRGTALITAMEDYIKKNPDADMAYELANSPLVSATSEAAQELRLAAERTPDSATAKLQELRQAQEKQAGGKKQIAARKAAVKEALPEANKVLLPKEELSWDRFLEAIKC